jgi:HAD superfamily hydrolase (TIGR01509 family)
VTSSPALLLDLDGTLVDSVILHTLAWTRALEEAGTSVPMSRVQPLIGMGGPQLLDEVIGRDAPEVERAHGELFEKLRREVRPLPGAAELLQHARAAGLHVYVVTSSKPSDAEFLLGLLPGPSVDGVVHGDDVSRTKPYPDLFQVAVDRWGLDRDQCLSVGDSQWDVQAARQAGLRGVGVLTGGTPAERLFSAGAVAVYRSCRDLAEAPLAAGRR